MLHKGKWRSGMFTITGWWKLRDNGKFLIIIDPACGVVPSSRISEFLNFGIWEYTDD